MIEGKCKIATFATEFGQALLVSEHDVITFPLAVDTMKEK
jgi:hypothetical protein